MINILIVIGVLLTISIGLLILRGVKGPTYTLDSIERPIKGLLEQGYDGGFLIINVSYSKQFIQLRKYICSEGNYGISLNFPNAKWSSVLFEHVKLYCEQYSIEYVINSNSNNERQIDFLCVDF